MLLEKFSDLIDRSGFGKLVDRKRALIDNTDPNRIYVENVRSFFGLSPKIAEMLCDLAVREGRMEARVGYCCPKCNSLIYSEDVSNRVEAPLQCKVCETMGEVFEHAPSECRKMKFYRLVHG